MSVSRKLKPNGTISAVDLCDITGLTDRHHRRLATAGYFPSPIGGKYQRDKTLAGIIRYQREQILKKDDTREREQNALAKVRRETQEMELAILRDEFVRKSVIGPALRNLSLHQRAVLQRKFEQEVGPKLDGLTTLERMPIIRRAIDDVCAIFQEGTASWMSENSENGECKPQLTS